MKLGLGTAQFGLDYGISNSQGRTPAEEVRRILETAASAGVLVLDTAAGYGAAEAALGDAGVAEFDVVTKVEVAQAAAAVESAVAGSLARMRLDSCYAVLAHDPGAFTHGDARLAASNLLRIKADGLARKVGVSVYSSEEIEAVTSVMSPDVIQVPVNILDQRLLKHGHLAHLADSGVEIHVRSAFLQGALLVEPRSLPPYFDPWRDRLSELHVTVAQMGFTAVEAALGFVCSLPEVHTVVCGVTDSNQLRELISAAHSLPSEAMTTLSQLACDDVALLDPSRWPA